MEHSIALVTGTTAGLGYAAAGMLATKGYRQIIITGRSLAGVQKTVAQLAAETKRQVFAPTSVQSALAKLVRLGLPSISYCSMQGWSQVRSGCSLRRASRWLMSGCSIPQVINNLRRRKQ